MIGVLLFSTKNLVKLNHGDIMKNFEIKRFLKDLIFYLIGGFIFSAAVTMFISANEISPGGFAGIATIINFLTRIPSGITLFILNIPILILGFLKFGGFFIIKTALATSIASFMLTVSDLILPSVKLDRVLAAVFGGILMGLGLSLVMLRGATTGGVDIIAKLINKKFRHLTVGRIILIIDAGVIAIASIIYRNFETALYSIIAMFLSSFVMDKMLYGADKGKLVYIITASPDEICKEIITTLRRGVTRLSVKGGYTSEERTMLMCIVRRYEVSGIYDIINRTDNNAFIVIGDVGEIIGEGFKPFS